MYLKKCDIQKWGILINLVFWQGLKLKYVDNFRFRFVYNPLGLKNVKNAV